jgi:thymidylate kinase
MRSRPIIVSFSGIDGAGKSTQIIALENHLRNLGFRIIRREFWDQVAVFCHFREFVSFKAFKGDQGVGSPERPIQRRDKNVSAWYVRMARLFFYAMDALRLRLIVSKLLPMNCDFVVFDRYIYDELANLPLDSPLMKTYAMFILSLAPTPDLAYLLDADPSAARLRKPEYPLDFLRQNRGTYLQISKMTGKLCVVPTLSAAKTFSEVVKAIGNLQPSTVSGPNL